jgi:N-carbamoyl-L-amino-acid hydrolase
MPLIPLSIDPDRFKDDFDALAQIGSTGDGGVNRPALSEAHLEARRWWIARAAEAGLETRIDGAGNHSAILRSSEPNARTLLLGSHTDSVPSGGRFDGALGVIVALEALRTIQDAGISLPVHLEAIDFTDEEGTLVGLTGSGALAGQLTAQSFENPRGGRARWQASLARAGLTEASILSARRDPKSLAGYLELHIEQGPRLFNSGIDIGVVSGIVGIRSYQVTYRGEANHAGTTPMETRRDASLGASAFILAARDLVMKNFPGCVVNVGQMALRPGAFNIVPGLAELSLEFRAPEPERLAQLETALLHLAERVASQYNLALTAQPAGECVPAPMSGRAQQAIIAAVESLGLSHVTMPSGAGHDAMMLAPLTDAGMIFVASRGGISHSPHEFTEWRDCVNGANVLLRAALNMAESD